MFSLSTSQCKIPVTAPPPSPKYFWCFYCVNVTGAKFLDKAALRHTWQFLCHIPHPGCISLTKNVPAHFAQYKNLYCNTLDPKIDKSPRNCEEAKEEDNRVGSDGRYCKHKEKLKDCWEDLKNGTYSLCTRNMLYNTGAQCRCLSFVLWDVITEPVAITERDTISSNTDIVITVCQQHMTLSPCNKTV